MSKNVESISASVVIPSFNAASSLVETLRSVISELDSSDEVIVVDDGSTDNTAEVIQGLDDSRIRYIYQPNSGGPASPRNNGIAAARGELVFLFDSDDLMLPGKIAAGKAAYLSHPDSGLIFSNFRTINEQGQELKERFLDDYEFVKPFAHIQKPIRLEGTAVCRALARENFIGTSGVAIPRLVFEQIGFFDESLRNGDDRDMWFRITRTYPVIYMPETFHSYRIHAKSISKGSAHNRVPSKLRVLEQQLADPIDNGFKADIQELIADNYHALAYESFVNGNMSECRQEIIKGLRASRRGALVRLWALSFLGSHLASYLRHIKRKING